MFGGCASALIPGGCAGRTASREFWRQAPGPGALGRATASLGVR